MRASLCETSFNFVDLGLQEHSKSVCYSMYLGEAISPKLSSSMLHIRQSFPSKHIYFYHDKVKRKLEFLQKKSLVITVAELLPYIF